MAHHPNGTLDEKLLPSVGNGRVATNVFSADAFVNGVYSGRLGESHRARLRPRHSSDFAVQGCSEAEEGRQYLLDMYRGERF